ncbi:MAG: SGNH/GDSL hydrolase family protein [Phycisphaerae bacterium]
MSRPNVFVLGDSISLQFGPYLQELLAGRYGYARRTGEEEALGDLDHPAGANGGDSPRVLAYLQALKAEGTWRPDLLLLNCGLHDLKVLTDSGEKQVPPELYRRNLEQIAALLREADVPTVWLRTTPVCDEIHNRGERSFYRYASDVAEYNAIADAVMKAAGNPIVDLHGFTESLGEPEEVFCDHVHFVDDVRRMQAAYLAGVIDLHFGM